MIFNAFVSGLLVYSSLNALIQGRYIWAGVLIALGGANAYAAYTQHKRVNTFVTTINNQLGADEQQG